MKRYTPYFLASLFIGSPSLVIASNSQSNNPLPPVKEPYCNTEQYLDLCLDGIPLSVTAIDNLRFSSSRILGGRTGGTDESDEKIAFLHGDAKGLAAGDGNGWALWMNATAASFSSDFSTINSGGKTLNFNYDANQMTYTTGVDFFAGGFIYGFAIGYERTNTDTFFNGGGIESDGMTISPYFAFMLNDMMSIDASVGYSALEHTQDRVDIATASKLNSSFDSERLFANINFNFSLEMDKAILTARTGLMYNQEKYDKYVETPKASFGTGSRSVSNKKVHLTQGLIGLDVVFKAGLPFETYVFANYLYDFNKNIGDNVNDSCCTPNLVPDDDSAFETGLGLSYLTEQGFSANIEFLKTTGRSAYKSDSLSLTLRQEI